MPSDSARLAVVQQCVQQMWMARANGEWAALERHLIFVLTGNAPIIGAPPVERRVQDRRSNVILLSDYLDKRRGERRRRKPP